MRTRDRGHWTRVLVGVVAAAVVAGEAVAVDAREAMAAVPAATRAAAPVTAAAGKPKRVVEAPDLVSARVAARAQGVRVEAVSERTESLTTWVNPDGTLTTEASTARVRFRDAKNGNAWRDIDLSLRDVGGQVVPASSDLGLSLSAGGAAGSPLATVDLDATAPSGGGKTGTKTGTGRSVSWALGGAMTGARLPKPTLIGTTATYAGVSPGVDVRVQVRPSGFEQDFILKDRAAVAALAGSGGSFTIPLRTKGLSAKPTADGGVAFVDAKGRRASFIPAPVAWDANLDPRSGEPGKVPVKLTVAQLNPGGATLAVTPDPAWLADPARQFPIVVDPYASLTVNTSSDLWVATNYPSTDTGGDPELKVGTYDGGTTVARSFLQFPRTAFKGYDIVSANLKLYETHAFSCTAKPVYLHSSQPADSSTRWGNQPAIGATYGSATVAKGYSSSCAAGTITIPMTDLARFWAGYDSTITTFWVALQANETDSYGWKRFSSANGSYAPRLEMTYNRKPNAAAPPDLGGTTDGSNTYTTVGTGPVQRFTKDATPKFHSSATDPDGNQVGVTFEVHNTTTNPSSATLVASCATALGGSGASPGVSCSPTTALSENKTYYVRAAVKDERGLWNGTWSPWTTFYTEWSTPPTPRVSCDQGYTSGTWTDADPAGTVTCSITSAGASGTYQAPGYLDITVDGVTQPRMTITPTNDWNLVHKTYAFPITARGYHEITVTGLSRSLVPSAQASYGFGWGSASLTTPTVGTASSGTVKVTAGGPPKGSATAVTAKVQWRVAASGNELTGWTDGAGGPVPITPSGTVPTTYTGTFDLTTATHEAAAAAGVDVPKRTPVRLDMQVCFTYAGGASSVQCTWSQSPLTVTRLPHAFGGGYPTADAGVGQVALYTGEVALEGTDVSAPGYAGDITISRSHTSFAGDGTLANWPTDTVTGVFGPGWTANLEGGAAGQAGLQVVDNTGIDGSVAFLDGEGEPLVYVNPANARTYPASSVTYLPATQDTTDAATRLSSTGTGASMRLTLTEEDGTKTVWEPLAPPSTTGTTWRPITVSEPGQSGATTFGHDASGRVNRIVAPVPDGMSGTACPTSGALARGCRAIDLTYASTTTATATAPGAYAGRVTSVSAWLWNPDLATPAMAQTTVATYAYDTSGRLVQVTDPRTGLGTTYAWDGTSTRIASVKTSGLAATKYTYAPTGPARLTQVSREAPVFGQPDVTIARYAYEVPTSGSGAAGLPNLAGTAGTDAWHQARPPVTGYAVFGQDYTGPVAGSGTSWPGVDWTYADLSYVDDLGYTVNTASYGAGAWQVASTDYDTATGNVVRSLDASATAAAAAKTAAGSPLDPADIDALSTQTVYNTEAKDANGTVVLPAGSRVVDTYGAGRNVVLADGTTALARPHTHTDYDQGAPNSGINAATGQRYSLPTTVTVTAATTAGAGVRTDIETVSTTTTGYDKIIPTDPTEGDGWALGAATKTTTSTPGGGITSITRHDTIGRTIETRQPMSTGTDAGTTRTAYYTPGGQTGPDAAANAVCGNHPEWAGLTCRTYPAAAPSQGPTLPDETTTYSMWLQPATVTETSGTGSGAATRTTTTSYDPAGRTVSSKITSTGLTGSTARPGSYTKYRTDNGLVDYTGWLNTAGTDADPTGRTTTSYDRWGRAIKVVGDAGQVDTGYDSAGRLGSVTDAHGTTAYGYDGTGTGGLDAGGKKERRGLITSLTVSRVGAGTLSYAAAYDAQSRLARQGLPGGLTQVIDYDQGGEPIGLSYLGQVTPVTASTDPDGNPVYTPGTPLQNEPWISWSTANDITGRVRFQTTDAGAAFDNGAGVASIDEVNPYSAAAVGQADSYSREYRYDPAGRLTYARTADTGTDPTTNVPTTACTERAYTFDANGRRTELVTTTHTTADCSDTGSTSHVATTGWDTADRPTTGKGGTGSYVYDLLGRQTTIPAADAPNAASTPGAGDITLGYYDDDLPRTITQPTTSDGPTSTATTFTLDAAGRRSTQTSTTTSGANPGATTTVRRYTDDGDNPAWVETTAPGATSAAITRFAESIGGDLSASITDTGTDAGAASLSLADPHGDIVTTVTIAKDQASTTPAVAINGWASYDEYGNACTAPGATADPAAAAAAVDQVDGPIGYGWLGAKQRSTTTDTAGLTLMGVRLYNNQRGLFSSTDPVTGANQTAYAYPLDPVGTSDPSGKGPCRNMQDAPGYRTACYRWVANRHNPHYHRSYKLRLPGYRFLHRLVTRDLWTHIGLFAMFAGRAGSYIGVGMYAVWYPYHFRARTFRERGWIY